MVQVRESKAPRIEKRASQHVDHVLYITNIHESTGGRHPVNKNDMEKMAQVQAVVMEIFRDLKRVCEQNDIQYFVAFGSLLGAVRHKGFIPWDEDMDIWMTRENYRKLQQHKKELKDTFELVGPDSFGKNKYYDSNIRLCHKNTYIKLNEELCRFYGNKCNRLHVDIFLLDRTYTDIRGKIQLYELFLLYGLMNAYRSKDFDISHYTPIQHFINKCFRVAGRLFPLEWLKKRAEKVAGRYDMRQDTNTYKVTTDSFVGMKRCFPRKEVEESIMVPFEDTQVSIPRGYDTILKIIYGDYMKLPPEEEQVPHVGAWYDLENSKISMDDFVFEEP